MAPDSGFHDLVDGIHDDIKDTFSEEISYEPLKGGSLAVQGVYNDKYQFVDPDSEQGISSQQPTVGVKLVDLPAAPAKGDEVVIRGTRFRVRESREDGEGWAILFLYKK